MRRLFTPLVIVTAVMFALAPVVIANALFESTMGLVQKIFYFHVPSWFAMFTAVFVCGIESAVYLFKGRQDADRIAASAAEIAVLFGALGLVGILANSVRATNDARYRSEAANLASAMVAEMWTTTAAQLDAQFGPRGPKLTSWQTKAASLLPSAGVKPPSIDLTQPGLSSQSRAVVVTVFWQLPGASELHQYVLTAQIGKNT